MRRTLLVSSDFPPLVGGVATYYAAICRSLPSDRIGVLTQPAPRAAAFDRRAHFPVHRERLLHRSPLLWPRWLPSVSIVKRLVKRQRYEQLLVGQVLPFGTVAWWLHRRLGIPYVVVVHGMDIALPRGRRRWLCRAILNRASAVVAVSQATAQLMRQYLVPREKITVITPGVAPATAVPVELTTALQERFRLKHAQVLLTVGRLVPRKGHRQVLAILPRLARQFPNLRYLIVGDGPLRANLQRTAQTQGVADRVVFTGPVLPSELAAWYELCDVFVMPVQLPRDGDVEGFGLVYLEASNYGKPVVAADVGGVREAVADDISGLLVPPGDAAALATAVARLLADPAFAHRLGLQGQARVTSDFRWESRAAQFAQLLSADDRR